MKEWKIELECFFYSTSNASCRMEKNLFYYMIQYFLPPVLFMLNVITDKFFFLSSSAAQIEIAEDRK